VAKLWKGFGVFGLICAAVVGCGGARCGVEAPETRGRIALTYLGAAGWRVENGGHVVLVDPYFSRVDGDGVLLPNLEAILRYAPERAEAILVGHSHYDHLLDVPDVAKRTGAVIVGTPSTLNVARAAGIGEERLVDATTRGNAWTAGPWSVKAIRGLHSLIGKPSLNIARDIALPMGADGYAEGGVLDYVVVTEGRAILFIGSANFAEDELRGLHPDVAVVATPLREKIPDYTCRLMRVLDAPPLVIANHFDACLL
jgi:L-ascorbate metabolism protein UlaG (beta-lactamase superfamily)